MGRPPSGHRDGSAIETGLPGSAGASRGALGEALRLVPSVTHNDKIMVPADAEIVIEGFLPPNRIEAEGPFAEFQMPGPRIPNPVVGDASPGARTQSITIAVPVCRITVPDNMGMEGYVYSLARQVSPSLINVHVRCRAVDFTLICTRILGLVKSAMP